MKEPKGWWAFIRAAQAPDLAATGRRLPAGARPEPTGGRVEVILTALVDDCRPVVFLPSHGVALADDEFVPLARWARHTDSRDGSPYRSHWIVLNLVVRRQQGQAVRDRLTNQHPVEGIVVVLG